MFVSFDRPAHLACYAFASILLCSATYAAETSTLEESAQSEELSRQAQLVLRPESSACPGASLDGFVQQLAKLTVDLEQARDLTRLDPSLEFTRYRVDALQAKLERITTRALRCLNPDDAETVRTKANRLNPYLGDLRLSANRNAGPSFDDFRKVAERQPASRGAISNDSCSNATTIGLGSFAGSTAGSTNDGEASCGASLFSPDVWFRYIATDYETLVFDTKGSDFDTVVSVHQGCPDSPSHSERICSDDGLGTASAGSFYTYAGSEYLIRIAGYNGATGNYQFTLGEGAVVTGAVASEDPAWVPQGSVRLRSSEGYTITSHAIPEDGSYSLSSRQAGTAFVMTENTNLVNEVWDDVPCLPNCLLEDATPLQLGADTAVVADFELGPGGTITGRIVDDTTGLVLVGARVRVARENEYQERTTFTDATGNFHFSGLIGGSYQLLASASGYTTEYFGGEQCSAQHYCDPNSGLSVQVTLGETTSGIDFSLDPFASISGTVRSVATGLPIEGITVRFFRDYSSAGQVLTDENGHFSEALAPGIYYLSFSGNQWKAEIYDNVPMIDYYYYGGAPGTGVVLNSSNVVGVDADLERLARVSGTVTASGQPVGSANVQVTNGTDTYYASTDYSDGSYEVSVATAGTYYVHASSYGLVAQIWDGISCSGTSFVSCDQDAATEIVLEASTEVTNIDFDLATLGSIEGTVRTEGGDPINYASVWLYRDGQQMDSFSVYGGSFQIYGLYPGTYTLVAKSDVHEDQLYDGQPCEGGCDVTQGTPITVSESEAVTGVAFTLLDQGSISGSVTSTTGEPISATILAVRHDNGFVYSTDVHHNEYTIGGLPAGSYWVYSAARYGSDGLVHEVWNDKPCVPTCVISDGDEVVVVERSSVSGIDFQLDSAGRILGGATDHVDGTPIASSLEVFDESGVSKRRTYYPSPSYDLQGIQPGTYYLVAWADEHALTALGDVLCRAGQSRWECALEHSAPLTIGVGEEVHVDFALERRGGLSGTILSSDGSSTTGSRVELWIEQDSDYEITSQYVYDSAFRFSRLQPGTYFVVSTRTDDHLDESYDGIPCPRDPPHGCKPTKGTPITVLPGRETRHIDFTLRPTSELGVYGVRRASNGDLIPGAIVDVWNASGLHLRSLVVGTEGLFSLDLEDGTYYLSTDAGRGYQEMLHADQECPGGSAYFGACDPTSGTPLVISEGVPSTPVVFSLELLSLFSDGFESGDSTAWAPN